jgi:hypothetical protein
MSRTISYLARERRIARGERDVNIERWQYGRDLLVVKAGRLQLPHGFLEDRVREAERAGLKGISRQELQRRLRFAEVYGSEAKVRQALTHFGGWSAIVNAGFPTLDGPDVDDPTEAELSTPPDAWEQGELIPGFGETFRLDGRTVVTRDATVGQARRHREKFREMHESFGKTLAQLERSVDAMVTGSGGDDEANALDAYRRAGGV